MIQIPSKMSELMADRIDERQKKERKKKEKEKYIYIYRERDRKMI